MPLDTADTDINIQREGEQSRVDCLTGNTGDKAEVDNEIHQLLGAVLDRVDVTRSE